VYQDIGSDFMVFQAEFSESASDESSDDGGKKVTVPAMKSKVALQQQQKQQQQPGSEKGQSQKRDLPKKKVCVSWWMCVAGL